MKTITPYGICLLCTFSAIVGATIAKSIKPEPVPPGTYIVTFEAQRNDGQLIRSAIDIGERLTVQKLTAMSQAITGMTNQNIRPGSFVVLGAIRVEK